VWNISIWLVRVHYAKSRTRGGVICAKCVTKFSFWIFILFSFFFLFCYTLTYTSLQSFLLRNSKMEKSAFYNHNNHSQVYVGTKRRPSAPPDPQLSPVSDRSFENDHEALKSKKPEPVTWMSLPRKDQLAILFLCRLVDFLQVASMQAYVFYQLKSFDTSLSDSAISTQAGILQGCFTGAQVLTAILWGKAADASWCGRKMVLVIGLGGTAISCLGYGFATTFFWAAFWRVVGGGINGTVGIM
jgi:hypothetical protein